jgi:hypothetical protein
MYTELPVEIGVTKMTARTELTESIMYFRVQRISQFAGETTTIGFVAGSTVADSPFFEGGARRRAQPASLCESWSPTRRFPPLPERCVLHPTNCCARANVSDFSFDAELCRRLVL